MNNPNRFLKLLTIVCFAAAFGLIGLFFFGYGHIQIEVPSDAAVQINGHPVTAQKLKLRFGSYQIMASGPNYKLSATKLSVPLFGTTVYKPVLQSRDDNSVLTSSLAVDGAFGEPQFTSSKWFDNNQWVAGQLSQSGNFTALHYQNGQWSVAYYQPGGTYSSDLNQLPADVASYVKAGETSYAAQQH